MTLTLYAYTSKTDVTVYIGGLWVVGWALIAFSVLLFILFFWNSRLLTFAMIMVSILSAIVYGFYLLIDTQLIIGGQRYGLTLDDYIIAAVIIYVDIIVLFMRILQVIALLSRR